MPERKTIDDLAKQVIDAQAGLMSVEDLKVFFEDEPTAPNPTIQTPVEPVIAPAPQASTATPAPTAEAVVSQPSVQEFLPEKFKDVDDVTSTKKLVKSYADLEAELKKEKESRENLDRMVQNLSTPPEPAQSVVPTPTMEDTEDVDDSLFFEKPKEATTRVSKKVATEVAAAMLIAYHNALTEASKRVQYVEAFKVDHPDFAEYREDLAVILRARPDLDKKPESLPMVYEMAKSRHRARLEQMRKELGVTTPATPTPLAPAPPAVNEAELTEKIKAAVIAEIQKRKAASGLTGGGSPTSPTERGAPVVIQQPKTREEEIFDEMQASGPKQLSLNL